ncbi:MAG: hypothetical protein ACOQNV_00940 [Mycoplasmoidaceae bacterium]
MPLLTWSIQNLTEKDCEITTFKSKSNYEFVVLRTKKYPNILFFFDMFKFQELYDRVNDGLLETFWKKFRKISISGTVRQRTERHHIYVIEDWRLFRSIEYEQKIKIKSEIEKAENELLQEAVIKAGNKWRAEHKDEIGEEAQIRFAVELQNKKSLNNVLNDIKRVVLDSMSSEYKRCIYASEKKRFLKTIRSSYKTFTYIGIHPDFKIVESGAKKITNSNLKLLVKELDARLR